MIKLRGFKFAKTLPLVLKKIESENKTKHDIFCLHSKAETIIYKNDIDDNIFKSIFTTVVLNIQKFVRKCSGSPINSVIEHNINISKYNPLAGSSYIKLAKEIDHPRKGLINIQNISDNKWLKQCKIR